MNIFTDGSKDPKQEGQVQLLVFLSFKVAVIKRATGNLSDYTMELMGLLLAAEWVEVSMGSDLL